MNIAKPTVTQSARAPQAARPPGAVQKLSGGRRPAASRAPAAGPPLAREARRLLDALAMPGAVGLPDPFDPGRVILRREGAAASLSAGSFARAAVVALVSRGLAAWSDGRLRLDDAGRAHLARAAAPSDGFNAQHRACVTEVVPGADGPGRAVVNTLESPLAWLRRRKGRDGAPLVGAAAFEAGERLRADLPPGGIMPGVTLDWGRLGAGGLPAGSPGAPENATDALVAARQRAAAALRAVGSDLADLLVDLCFFLKPLGEIERARGWPSRSAKVAARLALDRLAAHYGIADEARGRESARGPHAWRAP